MADVIKQAKAAKGKDDVGCRASFIKEVEKAQSPKQK